MARPEPRPGPVFFTGDDTLGVTIFDKGYRNALGDALRQSGQWLEVVPGAEGLTVQYDPLSTAPPTARAALEAALLAPLADTQVSRKTLVIPVCYEGDYALDMAHICQQTGLGKAEIIARHTGMPYLVDMLGFTPGFAYLEEADPALNVARLETPRTRLPAGAVGLAGGRCGLYALPGPGGWPIVGRTPMPLFRRDQAEPFRIRAGQSITFKAISTREFTSWVSK